MCSICDLNIEFSFEHPLTLDVAVATRRAIDSGLLPEPPTAGDAVDAMAERTKAIDALIGLQRRLEQTLSPEALLALPDFFALVVESRTWGFFHPTPTGFDPNAKPSAPRLNDDDPAQRDVVALLSEVAAKAILAGRLPIEDALGAGLVAIDADETRRGVLLSALCEAYPKTGFSRFVCA